MSNKGSHATSSGHDESKSVMNSGHGGNDDIGASSATSPPSPRRTRRAAQYPSIPPPQPHTFSMVPHGRHLARGALEGAEVAFRRGARRLNKHPILGLASGQRQKYFSMKEQIDQIRDNQRAIFLDQFKQFPDLGSGASSSNDGGMGGIGAAAGSAAAADYSHIWNSFKDKDSEVEKLTTRLDKLCTLIDEVNTSAAKDITT